MSTDGKAGPSTGYTLNEHLDKSRTYDCDFCPVSSSDVDSARAHRAIHVAGPELLEALADITGVPLKSMSDRDGSWVAIYRNKIDAGRALVEKVQPAKAQPAKGTTS